MSDNRIWEDRILAEGIDKACQRLGIKIEYFTDNGLIRMTKDGRRHMVFIYNFDCNSQAASAIAFDKVATYLLLNDAGLEAVPHFLVNSLVKPAIEEGKLAQLYDEYRELVIKPIRGSRGEDVAKPETPDGAVRYMNEAQTRVWAASPFIDIEYELRVVVFDGEVRLAYRKFDAPVIGGLKMFNVHLGAKAEGVDVAALDPGVVELAVKAMDAIGLTMGAVDIAIKTGGEVAVLEINSGFSLEHYAQMSDRNRQEAEAFYELVVEQLFA